MDLEKVLRNLYEERRRINRVIDRLESRLSDTSQPPPKHRRGRKGMSAEERLKVSERMTAYWAARRARTEEKTHSESGLGSESIGNGVSI
jgi:hypothetical protein